jgi:DNA topoisomerase IB
MLDFARALPRIRRQVGRDIRGDELSRERVLACAVRLLDRGLFRVGSEEYAEANGSYGLATLGRDHVTIRNDGTVVFDYTAKAGVRRVQEVEDAEAYDVLAALKRRRGGGAELLAYRNGAWCDVRSSDVNEYVKAASAADFTAKDFRTWHATVLAAVAVAAAAPARSERAKKRVVAGAIADVAQHLGNTPSVCRASYIDPRVFDRYMEGHTIARSLESLDAMESAPARLQRRVESAVLDMLDERPPARARTRTGRPSRRASQAPRRGRRAVRA